MAIAGGGTLLRQVIKLGLFDELELHIVPVILGDGMRLLDPGLELGEQEGIELTPDRVITTPEVTHIRYKLNGRRPLVLDKEDETRNPPPPRRRDVRRPGLPASAPIAPASPWTGESGAGGSSELQTITGR